MMLGVSRHSSYGVSFHTVPVLRNRGAGRWPITDISQLFLQINPHPTINATVVFPLHDLLSKLFCKERVKKKKGLHACEVKVFLQPTPIPIHPIPLRLAAR